MCFVAGTKIANFASLKIEIINILYSLYEENNIIIFINFFFAPISENFLSYFIKTDIASNPNYLFHSFVNLEMWGAIFSVLVSISSIIFGIVLSTKTVDRNTGKSIKKWLFAFGVLVLVLAFSYMFLVDKYDMLNTFLIVFMVVALLMGMMLSFINIPASTIVQTITEPDKLGKVSSITDLVSQGLIPVATFGAGFVISYFGCSVLLIVCSVGLLVVATMLLFNKSMNDIEL